MAYDSCNAAVADLAGSPMFEDISTLLDSNPTQLNYGVSVTDLNGNGKLEFVVAGFGVPNQAYEYDPATRRYAEVAAPSVRDGSGKAIGVAACDIDADGVEELYVLNT